MKVGKFYRNREERCISGGTGCGVVYLSGCDMRCAYCLVYGISQGGNGVTYTPRQLAELLLSLQQRGVSHISLANVEPSADEVIEAIAIARKLGLTVPLCNNFNGYAPAALTERLLPYFQAYIMDFKYADDALGQRLSAVPAYPAHARANLALLSARYGSNRYDAVGLLQSGVLLRHLILPGQWQNTEDTLRLLAQNNPHGYPLSLLPDFVPEGNTARCTAAALYRPPGMPARLYRSCPFAGPFPPVISAASAGENRKWLRCPLAIHQSAFRRTRVSRRRRLALYRFSLVLAAYIPSHLHSLSRKEKKYELP